MSRGLAASTATTYLSLARTSLEMELGWKLTIPDAQIRLPKLMRPQMPISKGKSSYQCCWRSQVRTLMS